jgi:hypothetical protein
MAEDPMERIQQYAVWLESRIEGEKAYFKREFYPAGPGRIAVLTQARDKLYRLFPELKPGNRAKESQLAQEASKTA